MNRFVDILNRIRENAHAGWLSPTQQIAHNLLRERLNFLDEINLWGKRGVGKTFVGWVWRSQGLAVYAPHLEEVGQEQTPPLRHTIFVDNLGWQRARVRDALHHCRSLGYEKIVLITTEPVQEQMSTVELSLTSADIERVKHNLRGIGVVPYCDVPRDLWDLVSPLSLDE